jgi:hypothetical protein
MPEDRISRLSQRFRTHAVGRKPTSNRVRERQTFYLDAELGTRLDKTYRDLSHQLYPAKVSKSAFLEAVIEHGLDRLPEVKATLSETEEPSAPSEPSEG